MVNGYYIPFILISAHSPRHYQGTSLVCGKIAAGEGSVQDALPLFAERITQYFEADVPLQIHNAQLAIGSKSSVICIKYMQLKLYAVKVMHPCLCSVNSHTAMHGFS